MDKLERQLSLQPDDDSNCEGGFYGPTYVLLTLKEEWYLRIKDGTKRYEFRRIFRNHPTTVFIYVKSPIQSICGKAVFGMPIIAPPQEIAEIAEEQRKGGGDSILEYMSGLRKGYAIPILAFCEIEPIQLGELRGIAPRFTPPQSYLILNRIPELLTFLLERPVRSCW